MNFNVTNDTNTYDYMNSFFSGLNNSSGKNDSYGGVSSLLGDLYAVQNGTYLKVAKKFYASDAAKSSQSADDIKKEMNLVKEATQEATSSLSKLMDESLYKQVEKTDDKGNKTYDYDRDAILRNIKSYIEDYNSLIEMSGDLEDTSTLKAGVRLVNQAEVYEGALARIGIDIKENNQLELDEEAFAKADIVDVKSLFTGAVSYAKNMQTKFFQMYSQANSNISSVNGLYSSQAQGISIGNMFDSML